MSEQKPGQTRVRHHRGRPRAYFRAAGRSGDAPTQARLLALRVLERVERARAYADLTLRAALARSALSSRDRALTTELVYGTLRWRGRLDFLLSHVLTRGIEKLEPLVLSCLRLGAYQLLFSERIPASAAIDEAVRCARAAGAERATGLVNAVLRRLQQEQPRIALPELHVDPLGHLVHALSLPTWIAERWLTRYGPDFTAALVTAQNYVPPTSVRVNIRQTTPEALLAELRERFPEAQHCRFAPDSLFLGRGSGDPARDPAFLEGRYTIQDEAAQLVVALLDPQPGEHVLDTCAAPGGKATAISERIGESGEVVAVDRHTRRLDLLRRDTRRLQLSNIHTHISDATQALPPANRSGMLFDRALVDAPCSGLGTLRRNPDARWRVDPDDAERLAQLQYALLARAGEALRPGGTLVYSTCTLLREENEDVVERFLNKQSQFHLVAKDALPATVQNFIEADGFFRSYPHLHDCDGFFAARLERAE